MQAGVGIVEKDETAHRDDEIYTPIGMVGSQINQEAGVRDLISQEGLNKDIQSNQNFASVHRHSFEQNNSYNHPSAQGAYREQAIQLRSNNSLEHSITNTSQLFPKQSRQ